jgi:hypothetical protein
VPKFSGPDEADPGKVFGMTDNAEFADPADVDTVFFRED